jgi:glycosyltransferase involved in cell wall biosynthesis
MSPSSDVPSLIESQVELSVVMPCLNEADTLEICIRKAQHALEDHSIRGEIIVADNGSVDGSPGIAERMGARVIHVSEKGYGNALLGGITAARGKYVLMGDADDSYDFLEIPKFVRKLREGYDLVQGCRFPSGGGSVMPHAMPYLHRRWGNPMLSRIARIWFRVPINDVYCGLRGFTKDLSNRLRLRCTGMEFAAEMIIKSSLYGVKIAEVPITLHPDGRKAHSPHLRTFRDGWRTMRFFMMYSPRWLFLIPGAFLVLLGLFTFALELSSRGQVALDAYIRLFAAAVTILCGYQSILFAILTKTYAISEGLMPEDKRLTRFFQIVNLERGIMLGLAAIISGILLLFYAFSRSYSIELRNPDISDTIPWVIPGATLIAVGFQTILSGFFVSILGMRGR